MSYAHVDNKYGRLTEFRERLSNEVHVQTGQEFPIFYDRDNILLGQNWRERIESTIADEIMFLVPIITPCFLSSDICRQEFNAFLQREKLLKRNDLIFSVYYVGSNLLDDGTLRENDSLAQEIVKRQWADWRGLRFESFDAPEVCKALERIAKHIKYAIERVPDKTDESLSSGSDVKDNEKISVYIVYSHRDEMLMTELTKHLKIMQRQNMIDIWSDRMITPGSEWSNEITSNFSNAELILFLISSDFLASDYCYGNEMRLAIEKHEAGKAVIIPIILRPVDWGGAPFAKLQALPRNAQPITTWADRNEAFVNVALGIRRAISMLKTK